MDGPKAAALEMARRGFRVLPLKPDAKVPFSKEAGDDPFLCGGVNLATTDARLIEAWFTHNPAINYGIAAGNGLVLLDCDVKKPTFGEDLLLLDYPKTLETETWSGGAHIYLLVNFDAGQRKLAGAPSIDVRARGGYVVGPGSVVNGKPYRIVIDAPVAPCPPELASRISRREKPAVAPATGPLCDVDLPGALADGWLLVDRTPGMAESEGIGRNNMAHMLAGKIKRAGCSPETCLEMVSAWNAKCHPPQPDDDVRKTVESCYTNGDWRIGEARPEVEFAPIDGAPAAKPADPAAPPKSLLLHPSEIRLESILMRQSNALIKGVLSPGDYAVSYGRSTAGKTFGVLDMCWHIACGKPDWHGRKVKKAPVLYVCLEGEDGFDKRTLAIMQVHGDPGVWFARLTVTVSLVRAERGHQGAQTILDAAKLLYQKCGQLPGLIVIDTGARATAGESQNDTEAVMAFVENRMGAIKRASKAAVMVVHHTNRAGDIRGALDWRNAMDVVLRWERDEKDDGEQRRCVAEKVKDGAEVTLFDFRLDQVDLGRDADGDPVNSCVLRSSPPAPSAKKGSPLQEKFRTVFESFITDPCDTVPLATIESEFKRRYCAGKTGEATRKDWTRAHTEKGPPDGLVIEDRNGETVVRRKLAGERRSYRTDPKDEFTPIDGAEGE